MKTSRLMGLVLVLALGIGCDGGGDSKRTDLSCAPNAPDTAQACESAHSEVPAKMSCVGGWHSVASCSVEDVLATCTLDDGPLHFVLYVYDAGTLDTYQAMCAESFGTWEEFP